MRIILCLNRTLGGGAEYAGIEACLALKSLGHDVHLVVPDAGPALERLEAEIPVHVLYYNPWEASGVKARVAVRCLAYDLLIARRKLADLFVELEPDVIVTNTLAIAASAFAARTVGLPHIWFVHEYGYPDHGARYVLGRRATLKVVGRLSDLVLAVSQPLAESLEDVVGPGRVGVVPQAVELPLPARGQQRPSSGGLRLINVGNRMPLKRQSDAIMAVGLLRRRGYDVRLDFLGRADPRYETELLALVDDSGLSEAVKFLPFDADPGPYISAADVLVVCSVAEGFGRVAVEAMKLGKPVVGAADGGTVDLIAHGETGYLYPPGDVSALSEQLAHFLEDDSLIEKMGARGRDFALRTFTRQKFAHALEAAAEEAIRRRHVRRGRVGARPKSDPNAE